MPEHDKDLDPTQSTRDWIELKIQGLRSEMRMLFILSVAGNQLLTHLSLSSPIAYAGSGILFAGGVALKVLGVWGL